MPRSRRRTGVRKGKTQHQQRAKHVWREKRNERNASHEPPNFDFADGSQAVIRRRRRALINPPIIVGREPASDTDSPEVSIAKEKRRKRNRARKARQRAESTR
jgi:hypothetical protein